MHVEPVVVRPEIEDRRHPDDAVVGRLIAQLGRCFRRDCSQSLAELAPEMRLTRLHDPEYGPHGAVHECRRDRRLRRPHVAKPEGFRPRDFVDTVAFAVEHLVDPEVGEGQLLPLGCLGGLLPACLVRRSRSQGAIMARHRLTKS